MELRKRSICKNFIIEKSNVKKQKKDILERKTQIEDLSGEIWFELFAYFDGESLINLFSSLNSSIESLLNDYRLPIHLNILCRNFLIPSLLNLNQIISLSVNYSCVNSNEIIDISSFIRLRSLCLLFINDQQLEKTSQFQFNNLYQISIQSKSARFITKIISIYFPHVNRMKLNSMEKEFIVKSFDYNKKIKNQIKYLILDGTIKLVKLFRLWSFVPNLRSLSFINGGIHQCDYWINENIISYKKFPQNLLYIHIKLYDDDMSFSNFERLIPKNICYIKLSGSIADDDFDDYISSTNWIRLISNCSNNLQRIKLDISSYFDPSDSSGLQKTLAKFRRNSFFRNTIIQSKNFFITIKGFIQPDVKN